MTENDRSEATPESKELPSTSNAPTVMGGIGAVLAILGAFLTFRGLSLDGMLPLLAIFVQLVLASTCVVLGRRSITLSARERGWNADTPARSLGRFSLVGGIIGLVVFSIEVLFLGFLLSYS